MGWLSSAHAEKIFEGRPLLSLLHMKLVTAAATSKVSGSWCGFPPIDMLLKILCIMSPLPAKPEEAVIKHLRFHAQRLLVTAHLHDGEMPWKVGSSRSRNGVGISLCCPPC